jgi:hypothetical protein
MPRFARRVSPAALRLPSALRWVSSARRATRYRAPRRSSVLRSAGPGPRRAHVPARSARIATGTATARRASVATRARSAHPSPSRPPASRATACRRAARSARARRTAPAPPSWRMDRRATSPTPRRRVTHTRSALPARALSRNRSATDQEQANQPDEGRPSRHASPFSVADTPPTVDSSSMSAARRSRRGRSAVSVRSSSRARRVACNGVRVALAPDAETMLARRRLAMKLRRAPRRAQKREQGASWPGTRSCRSWSCGRARRRPCDASSPAGADLAWAWSRT